MIFTFMDQARYLMLCSSASGPEICFPGQIAVEFKSGKLQNRPKAGRRADFEAFPTRTRPKSGPEARLPARKHYCVAQGMILIDFRLIFGGPSPCSCPSPLPRAGSEEERGKMD